MNDIPKIEGYNYISLLGKGAFGSVYKVEKDGKFYAMKYYASKKRKEALKEIEILKIIEPICGTSSALVCYYESWIFDDYVVILIEYFEGVSLEEMYKHNRKNKIHFTTIEMYKIMKHLLTAISYLATVNTCHNDIHLGNILFNENKMVLIDFGLACLFNSDNPELQCKTRIRNNEWWSKQDVYSLGLMFLEMALLKEVLFDENTPLLLREMYPENIVKVIELSLIKEASQRPNASTLLEILNQK